MTLIFDPAPICSHCSGPLMCGGGELLVPLEEACCDAAESGNFNKSQVEPEEFVAAIVVVIDA